MNRPFTIRLALTVRICKESHINLKFELDCLRVNNIASVQSGLYEKSQVLALVYVIKVFS